MLCSVIIQFNQLPFKPYIAANDATNEAKQKKNTKFFCYLECCSIPSSIKHILPQMKFHFVIAFGVHYLNGIANVMHSAFSSSFFSTFRALF